MEKIKFHIPHNFPKGCHTSLALEAVQEGVFGAQRWRGQGQIRLHRPSGIDESPEMRKIFLFTVPCISSMGRSQSLITLPSWQKVQEEAELLFQSVFHVTTLMAPFQINKPEEMNEAVIDACFRASFNGLHREVFFPLTELSNRILVPLNYQNLIGKGIISIAVKAMAS